LSHWILDDAGRCGGRFAPSSKAIIHFAYAHAVMLLLVFSNRLLPGLRIRVQVRLLAY
jgi:hypothetical protein